MSDRLKIILACIIGIPLVILIMCAYLSSLIELIMHEKILFWVIVWFVLSLLGYLFTQFRNRL